ncbi:hypothetical protein T484DRAFT_1745277 [Baffinella frigidus]|nr:hypothetical protein T484DRAFT_1745277 [Cryptophyta sp. CCMP2293]
MHHTGRFGNHHLELVGMTPSQQSAARRASAPSILASEMPWAAETHEGLFSTCLHRAGKFNPFFRKEKHAKGLAALATFEHFRALEREREAREEEECEKWVQEKIAAKATEEKGGRFFRRRSIF